MAITTMTALQAAMPGQTIPFFKASTGSSAGSTFDYWGRSGSPAAGSTPATGSGEAYTSASTGAITFANPAAGKTLRLARLTINTEVSAQVTVYDRLVATSGLSAAVTTAQTINSTALTRYTDGVGVQAFLVIYSMIGSTVVDYTIDYVDATGTTVTSPTNRTISSGGLGGVQLAPIALHGGSGIRSVASLTLANTTGSAGNLGILLARPLTTVRGHIGTAYTYDPVTLGLPQVQADACLAFYVQLSTTSGPTISGELALAQG